MFDKRNDQLEVLYSTARTQEPMPNVPLPSPNSPLVLPGEPNPSNKPGLIPIFQYISNIYQQYIQSQVNVGYLRVNVTTDSGTMPLANAKITISKPLGNNIFMSQIVFTDDKGESPLVPLPTRSAELSLVPEYPVPYTIWNLTVEAPGYYEVIVYDIPIFPEVTTNQSINLLPSDTNLGRPIEEIYASQL